MSSTCSIGKLPSRLLSSSSLVTHCSKVSGVSNSNAIFQNRSEGAWRFNFFFFRFMLIRFLRQRAQQRLKMLRVLRVEGQLQAVGRRGDQAVEYANTKFEAVGNLLCHRPFNICLHGKNQIELVE